MHATFEQPKDFHKSRPEYQLFPLKVFRDHIYQIIRTKKYVHQLKTTGKGALWKEYREGGQQSSDDETEWALITTDRLMVLFVDSSSFTSFTNDGCVYASCCVCCMIAEKIARLLPWLSCRFPSNLSFYGGASAVCIVFCTPPEDTIERKPKGRFHHPVHCPNANPHIQC